MPTIEIASVNSSALNIKQADFDFTILEENELISHRGLFYELLIKQKGTIIHIGNPSIINNEDEGFFADQLIDWSVDSNQFIIIPDYLEDRAHGSSGANQEFIFKFIKKYVHQIDRLLTLALENSPTNKVLFLTDYQFGPEKGSIEKITELNEFWQRHDQNGLKFNTLYEISKI